MKIELTQALQNKLEEQAKADALGDVLSDWDEGLLFDNIIEQLENSDEIPDTITVWMPHEHLCPASLAELLRDTYQVQYYRLKAAVETAFNIQPEKVQA